MKPDHFPELIRSLPPFEGPFNAHQLAATGCTVLFASYPAGTVIDPHTHATENCGVITEADTRGSGNGDALWARKLVPSGAADF